MASIGVPNVRGMKSAFGDYAYGAAGGLVYGLGKALLGNGIIGSLAAPVLAGSVIKGTRGEMIATVAGFMALADLFSGAASAPASSNAESTM